MQQYFKRKLYDRLLDWKKRSNGKSAALIEGARRVGKSTFVKHFAESNYRTYIMVDFSTPSSKTIMDLIINETKDIDLFFARLQLTTGVDLYERESVIIFDEVQCFPLARQMIKHFVADGRFDYIETGSLISIKKNIQDILIPSDEERFAMHPMDFEEFLWAIGKTSLIKRIREMFDLLMPLGRTAHNEVMSNYRLYMLIGGMPQAISEFNVKHNFNDVEAVKKNIIDLYVEDSGKIIGYGSVKCKSILSKIPSRLSKHDKSFKPSDVKNGSRTRDYTDSVYGLSESKMVNVCYRCSDMDPATAFYDDLLSFKIYMADTGLLFTLAFENNIGDIKTIYDKIIANRMSINKGMFFENMVAQELVMNDRNLQFSKFSTEDSTHLNEVDFIIAKGEKIIPIEVKSSNSSEHISLDRFIEKNKSKIDRAYVIHPKDLRVDGKIIYLPIYMAMFI